MKTLKGVIEHEILQHYNVELQLPETTNPLMEDNYMCVQGHAPLINSIQYIAH